MSIENLTSVGMNAFSNSNNLLSIGTSIGAQSILKGPSSEDEGIFSTIWGIPVGTQFGTALFGEQDTFMGNMGVLAIDILTDPLTYLTFGIGGVSKLAKASQLMNGLTAAEKMGQMSKVMRMAKAAEAFPDAAKAVSAAAEIGDVGKFATAAKTFKKLAAKNGMRFDKLDEAGKGFSDLNQMFGNKNLGLLKTAFEYEGKYGSALQQFTETGIEMVRSGKRGLKILNRPFGIGASDPIQISKILAINKAPLGSKAKKLSEALEFVEHKIIRGTEGLFQGVGAVAGATGVMDKVADFSAVFSLNKEKGASNIIGEIVFLKNDQMIEIASKSIKDLDAFVSSTLAEQGVKFPTAFKRSMTPVHSVLNFLGEGGKYISGAMDTIRVSTEAAQAKAAVQLAHIFGDGQVYTKSIKKTMTGLRGEAQEEAFGLIMEGAPTFKSGGEQKKYFGDQVRHLVNFLDNGSFIEPGQMANLSAPGKGVENAAKIIRGNLDEVAISASKAGIKVISAEGVAQEFAKLDNFFPHIHNFQGQGAADIRESITQSLVKKAGFDSLEAFKKVDVNKAMELEEEVSVIMQTVSEGFQKKRFGSLESHRQFNVPGWKGDPLDAKFKPEEAIDALKIYFRASEERLSRIRMFGMDNDILTKNLEKIAQELPDTQAAAYAESAVRAFNGEHILSNKKAYDIVQGINSFQIVNKLAVGMAVLTNIGQSVNTAARTGFFNTAKSFGKQVKAAFKGDIDKFDRMGVIINSIVREERIVENSFTKFADTWLDWTGFNRLERFNRRVAAHSAVLYGDDLAKTLSKGGLKAKEAGREFIKMGYDEAEIALMARTGNMQVGKEVSEAMASNLQRKVARNVVEGTQFRTQAQDLPLWNASPWGKFFGLFKSFMLKQHEFVTKHVARPAVDYAVSNGKRGAVKPLITMALGGALAGEIIRDSKVLLDGGERPENIVDRMTENIGQTGVLGAWELAIGTAKFGDRGFINSIGGPNVDSARAILSSATGHRDSEKAFKQFYLRFLGPVGKRKIRELKRKKPKQSDKLKLEFMTSRQFAELYSGVE